MVLLRGSSTGVVDGCVPVGVAAAVYLAADAARRDFLDAVGELLFAAAPADDAAHVALGEAAVAAGRAKGAHLAGVGPAAEGGFIDVEELAGLAEREPAILFGGVEGACGGKGAQI